MNDYLNQDEIAYETVHVLDNRLTLGWYPQRVVQMAGARGSMLELGLGHGVSAEYFGRFFSRYVVVEGSPEIIAAFQSKFNVQSLEIVQGYFEDFSTEERFDSVGMGFILEHVNDPHSILSRYADYLAPGGSIYIAVPNAESLHRRFGHAAGMLPDMTSLSAGDIAFGHKRYYSMATLTSLIDSVDLSIKKVEGIFLKPITTSQLQGLNLGERILQAMLEVGVDYPELCNSILIQVCRK